MFALKTTSASRPLGSGQRWSLPNGRGTAFVVIAMIAMICSTSSPTRAEPPTVVASQLRRFEFRRTLMGVPFAAAFYAPDEASANKAIAAVWARIEHLNSVMSDYDSNSELMRLCQQERFPFVISSDLYRVLDKAQKISALSDGAFDVSVGPLVKLWRRARRQKELPDPKLLAEARELVGWKNIQLEKVEWRRDSKGRPIRAVEGSRSGTPGDVVHTASLLKPGMKLDLGGIAVGDAADEAIKVLKQHDITRAMIDGSGDIVVSDPPPGTTGWRIGIASLKEPDAAPTQFATLANCSISTSGDAYQFVEVAGQRYSHIVDPKTGLGLTERCSVTIIAPDGITADALATSVSVLGPERGLKLIESQSGVAALIATLDDKTLVTRTSSQWKPLSGETSR